MKKLLLLIFLIGCLFWSYAQNDSIIHHGSFKDRKFGMSSNPYKPDKWEKPFYDSSIKTAFPSDLVNHPDKYQGKLIHLVGIVDSVYIDSGHELIFRLENKYWDYIEDYSIQDEKMFISEKGDGKFLVKIPNSGAADLDAYQKFPAAHKLFLVYGNFVDLSDGFPVLSGRGIKFIDYEFYTTKVYSYEILRDKNGNPVTDKHGKVQLTNFNFLKVATAGQNK